MLDFLKAFVPAPVVDVFIPMIAVGFLGLFAYRKLSDKLKEHGVGEMIADKVGGEKLRLFMFEREIQKLQKSGDTAGAARLYEDAEWYPEAINLYIEAEDYTSAAALYEQLEQWESASEMYTQADDWKKAANMLVNIGKHEEAAQHYEEHGQKIDAAKLYYDGENYEKAAVLYTDVSYFPQAGQSYEKLGEFIKAAESYEEHWNATASVGGGGLISAAGDRGSKVALRAGKLYEQGGAADRAAVLYKRAGLSQQAAELAAKEGRFMDAGEILVREEELELAADMFEKGGDAPRAALLRGEIAFNQGDLDTAADQFLAGGDNLRAAELYETAERLEEAAHCYEQNDAPLQAAGVYLRAGETLKAAEMYERGREPEQAAKLYDEAGDVAAASRLYEESKLFFEAGSLAKRQDDDDRAIQLLQQVESTDEHYDEATLLLARLFLSKKLPGLAVDKLQRLIGSEQISGKTLEHFYCLGLAFEQLDKRSEAVATYRKIMTERYGYEDVEARIARLSTETDRSSHASAALRDDDLPFDRQASTGAGSTTAVAPPAPARTAAPSPPPVTAPTPQRKSAPSPIQLGELIGEGLLGATYKGTDSRSQSPVAVKLLRKELLADPQTLQQFIAEAKLARSLEHPSVVRMLGLIELDGAKAAVTEFVNGFTLQAFVAKNKQVSVKQGLDLLTRLTAAIGHGHERKLLHRDLKLGNILVGQGGQLKLTGFGFGALRGAALGKADGYPAPELLSGAGIGPRSDIYSLGAVLFHALTGENPEDHESAQKGLRAFVPDAPATLEEILRRCLMPDAADRFASAEELGRAVHAVSS